VSLSGEIKEMRAEIKEDLLRVHERIDQIQGGVHALQNDRAWVRGVAAALIAVAGVLGGAAGWALRVERAASYVEAREHGSAGAGRP
jgi:hypothetical protein